LDSVAVVVSEDARAEVRCFLFIIGRLENGGGVAATEIDLVALQQDGLGNTGRAEGVLGEVASLRILA